jgi:ribonuclease III
MDYKEFLEKVGISMKDVGLLKRAFTHRSYINENKNLGLKHNERLEFLGDAVLELVVTDYLFNSYPKKNEGDMTALRSALVNTINLGEVAVDINVNEHMLFSKGEAKDTGRARQYLLANAMEAIIGAIYLDGGYAEAEKFILKHIVVKIDKILEEGSWVDAKSKFQEKAQEVDGVTPEYRLIKQSGPDHDKRFEMGVYLGKKLEAKGEGKSKQDAEQVAATEALTKRDWLD